MRICSNCGFVSFSALEKKILKKLKRKKTASEMELVKHCKVSLTAVFFAINGLEKAGYVETRKEPARHGIRKLVWLNQRHEDSA